MTPELKSIATRIREFISRNSNSSGASVSTAGSLASDSDDQFNILALELFALQFASNPAYRRICESRGVKSDSIEHWTRIPAVPAAAFKEFELTCLGPVERTAVFYSSGTTGQRRSQHFHSAESLALYESSLWPWFEQHILAYVGPASQPARAGDLPAHSEYRTAKSGKPSGCEAFPTTANDWQLAVLTPPPAIAPNSSLVHMFQTVCRKCHMDLAAYFGNVDVEGGWTLDFARIEAIICDSVRDGRSLLLLGTAFNFVHLLDELAARKLCFQLPSGSVVMETGGYKGRSREMPKAELHDSITRILGVPRAKIICEYGMSELSSQAYDNISSQDSHDGARLFRFPPWARVQIISPETGREVATGETGLVRIFDLANAFSVLAVQTEDIALRRGDGFELIGRAIASETRGCSLMTA